MTQRPLGGKFRVPAGGLFLVMIGPKIPSQATLSRAEQPPIVLRLVPYLSGFYLVFVW